jgi:diguanylate cyclase (GGDEF)-like protein
MDNLKKINDLYGHNEGDKAIKAVASLMTKCTAEGGICSRFGGDEFVAVIAETDGADSFYEKISRSIAEYNRRSKSPYDVSISCGYKAGKPKTLKEIDDLMKASDREMYTQKRKHHSRRHYTRFDRAEDPS